MKKDPALKRKLYLAFTMAAAVATSACSTIPATQTGLLRTHSIDETQNTCQMSPAQAQQVADSLPVGTPRQSVYDTLKINNPQDLATLTSSDVSSTLYGGTLLSVPFQDRQKAQDFYASLQGQSLHCRNVTTDRTFGLTGSQLLTRGKDFNVTMIFQKSAALKGQDTLFSKVKVTSVNVAGTSRHGYLSGFRLGGKITSAVTGAF